MLGEHLRLKARSTHARSANFDRAAIRGDRAHSIVAVAVPSLRFPGSPLVPKSFECGIDLRFENRLEELAELAPTHLLEQERHFLDVWGDNRRLGLI